MESYFQTFKGEAIHSKHFKNQTEAAAVTHKYIAFYNEERLHSSLGMQHPKNMRN